MMKEEKTTGVGSEKLIQEQKESSTTGRGLSSHVHHSSFIIHRSSNPDPIGLLAGAGRFPIVFAEKARQLGIPVVCVGVRHMASPELIGLPHRFYWIRLGQLGRAVRCFKREGVDRAVMAGKILKAVILNPW